MSERRQVGFTSVNHGISIMSWKRDWGEWLGEVTPLQKEREGRRNIVLDAYIPPRPCQCQASTAGGIEDGAGSEVFLYLIVDAAQISRGCNLAMLKRSV